MATNPYFNFFQRTSEQELLESLIIESIKRYGHDVLYIPREEGAPDVLFGEDASPIFDETYEMEMYIKSFDEFGGDGDLFRKFGVEIRDQAKLVVAMSRFYDVTDRVFPRPREGDLIYFPMSNGLFEIHFVEDQSLFFQLGSLYVFELTIELFEYSHEQFNTGVPEIDEIEDERIYTVPVQLGAGSGDYVYDEIVYQGLNFNDSTMTAQVHAWDATTSIVTLKLVTGALTIGENLIGAASGSSYAVAVEDEYIHPNEQLDDNKYIQVESAAGVINFSEGNPFSEGDE